MNEDFEYCIVRSKKKCPLREKCLRAITPPFSTPYWTTGGRYNKDTKQCSMFIPKEDMLKAMRFLVFNDAEINRILTRK